MAVFGEGFLIGMRSNSAYEKRWSDGVQGQGLLASPLVAVINVSPFEDMVLSMLDQFDIVFCGIERIVQMVLVWMRPTGDSREALVVTCVYI